MGFLTDSTLCIGCKACEVACKQWNQLPADGMNVCSQPDGMKMSGNSYDNTGHLGSETWRHVKFLENFDASREEAKWFFMSDVCKHCKDAGCLNACPTGAIIRTEFDSVYVQDDICNGCGFCIPSCPFGVIGRAESDGGAHKCTLCYDRQGAGMEPACAKSCPTDSIVFGPVDELRERAQRRVQSLRERGQTVHMYGDSEDLAGGLNSIFILPDTPEKLGLPTTARTGRRNLKRSYAGHLLMGLAWAGLAAAALARGRGT
ncbi:MAG TPA: 4Fe-4S dicluster domain-containing protein [Candidatus Dormibacteraeota bacterium]|nr:4Fe-4S dicluster domain-containing protein [Candidatus Dormibacteraeota bacterium]